MCTPHNREYTMYTRSLICHLVMCKHALIKSCWVNIMNAKTHYLECHAKEEKEKIMGFLLLEVNSKLWCL